VSLLEVVIWVKSGVGTYRSLSEGTGVRVEHFRVDDPGGTVPRGTVESGPEVEEEHGSSAARAESLSVSLSVSSQEVATDDPHADGATSGADHQEVATTEFIDEEQEPNECENSLDNTEEAGSEESSVCTSDTDRFEDGGRVVVDGVDTTAVLPQEKHT
jgi:hypothetical protein